MTRNTLHFKANAFYKWIWSFEEVTSPVFWLPLLCKNSRQWCYSYSHQKMSLKPKYGLARLSLPARTFCWKNIVSQLFYYFVNITPANFSGRAYLFNNLNTKHFESKTKHFANCKSYTNFFLSFIKKGTY